MAVLLLIFFLLSYNIVVSLASVFSVASDTDWGMFHHDLMHTGYSMSTVPVANENLWTYETGLGVISSPAVVDGVVYIGGDIHVYALNATTGTLIWSFLTEIGNTIFSSCG